LIQCPHRYERHTRSDPRARVDPQKRRRVSPGRTWANSGATHARGARAPTHTRAHTNTHTLDTRARAHTH
jgi:hypothetical protein